MTQWNSIPVPAIQTRDELQKLVNAVKADGSSGIELSLADVERISTLTAQTLVAAAKSCKVSGKGFRLTGMTENTQKSLKLLGLDEQSLSGMAV